MQGSLMLDIGGTYLTAEDRHLLRQPQVCGVILFARNIEHPRQVRELCRAIRAVRSDLLVGVDQEGWSRAAVASRLCGFTGDGVYYRQQITLNISRASAVG